jgi:hypothetical protein
MESSVEELDIILNKAKSVFEVVKITREEQRRCGKHGEMLIDNG